MTVSATRAEAQPAMQPDEKRRYVREIFGAIAPRYDLLNRLLSLRIDTLWRRAAVAQLDWRRNPAGTYLDACAGTFDLALSLARRPGFSGRVMATDFALPMLRRGRGKLGRRPVRPAAADTLRLPFRDGSFDGALVGFGVRNLASVEAGLAELARVLRPGARLVILDFTTPRNQPLRALYLLYFRRVLPLVGRLVSGHPTAYSYLPDSVMEFASPEALQAALTRAGFRTAGHRLHTGGIAAVTWGER